MKIPGVTHLGRVLLLALVAAVLAGCGPRGVRLAAELPAPLTLPGAGAVLTAAPADSMLVVLSKRGLLSVLTNTGWQEPNPPAASGANAYCVPGNSHVALDADSAWAQCSGTVFSANGRDWSTAALLSAGRLVLGPAGRRAIVSVGRVTILQEGSPSLSFSPGSALGSNFFPNGGATFTPDGTLWLAGQATGAVSTTGTQLVSFDGQKWEHYGNSPAEVNLKPSDVIRILAPGPDGALYAATDNQLFSFSGGLFTPVVIESQLALTFRGRDFSGEINDVLPLPNGEVWLASSEGIFTWDGRDRVTLLDRGDGLPAKDVRGLARDLRGRVWAATAYGLALFDAGRWQIITPATSGLTDADLVDVAVRGAPDVPPALSRPKTTSIAGQISSASGEPVANLPVILCDEGPGANHRHGEPVPCAEQYYSRQVKTDAQGNYRFEDVPIGAYTIVTIFKETWYFAIRLPERDWQPIVALTPGQPAQMNMGLP